MNLNFLQAFLIVCVASFFTISQADATTERETSESNHYIRHQEEKTLITWNQHITVPALLLTHSLLKANNHIHMLSSIPPKHSVSQVLGFMKGKSSIWIGQSVTLFGINFG